MGRGKLKGLRRGFAVNGQPNPDSDARGAYSDPFVDGTTPPLRGS